MTNRFLRFLVTFILIPCAAEAHATDSLRHIIQTILSDKKATVGVAIQASTTADTLFINGNQRFPMQSVFKFHIGIAVLSEVDKGRLRLHENITITPQDLVPKLYSPIRDKYPNGTTLSLADVLQYTIAESDNVGCEKLLPLVGGPEGVEQYFVRQGFKDISIKINEVVMQSNWDKQFQNWTTPKAANEILRAFYFNTPRFLSNESYQFLWNVMKSTTTGKNRLKAYLPHGTIIAHKTGSSGTNKEGITAAVNDIGVITLPNGKPLFISVFVSDSRENDTTNENIIAEIAKAAYNYFQHK